MTDPKNTTHERKTLVEEGTQFKGALSSNCPIEVKGRIEGDVTAPALTVALGGAVHGKVKVGEIRSQGELAGEFDKAWTLRRTALLSRSPRLSRTSLSPGGLASWRPLLTGGPRLDGAVRFGGGCAFALWPDAHRLGALGRTRGDIGLRLLAADL